MSKQYAVVFLGVFLVLAQAAVAQVPPPNPDPNTYSQDQEYGTQGPETGEIRPSQQQVPAQQDSSSPALANAANALIQEKYATVATEVAVAVDDVGVIELSGSVRSLSTKLDIHADLVELDDHKIVVNRLQVHAPDRRDTAIRREIIARLRNHPILRNYRIGVRCRNQRVALTGWIPAPIYAQEALSEAAKVRGVAAVTIDKLSAPP